jgi:protein-S-isoprenylcysteine O-methyltransferase Ste14
VAQTFIARGGLWVLGQAGLLAWIGLGAICSKTHHSGRSAILVSTAILLLGLSAACGIAGTIALGRNLTPYPHSQDDTALVTSGIYGWMRHPLYTALILWASGWSLWWGSWPAGFGTVALVFFIILKARVEERHLLSRYPAYADYQRRVRGFIPGIF